MNTRKIIVASFLGLYGCAVFAQDGADRLQKQQEARSLERQQIREKLALSHDKKQSETSAVTSSVKNKDVSQAEGKPTH